MKAHGARFILPTCLLAGLAGWGIFHLDRHPEMTIPSGPAASNSVPVAVAAPSPPSEPPREPRKLPASSEPAKPKPAIRQASTEAALADPASPANAQDLDQNRDWARKFPTEAAAWLRQAPDGPQRDTIAEIVCPQLAQTDPAQAVALAEHCQGSGTNVMGNLLDNLALLWAGRDETAACSWATSKPPGEERNRLLGRIAFVQSQTDPQVAAHLVAEQIPPGETQNEAAISVLHQWAQRDAALAMAWAESFPPGDLHDRAIKEVENVKALSSAGQAAF